MIQKERTVFHYSCALFFHISTCGSDLFCVCVCIFLFVTIISASEKSARRTSTTTCNNNNNNNSKSNNKSFKIEMEAGKKQSAEHATARRNMKFMSKFMTEPIKNILNNIIFCHVNVIWLFCSLFAMRCREFFRALSPMGYIVFTQPRFPHVIAKRIKRTNKWISGWMDGWCGIFIALGVRE